MVARRMWTCPQCQRRFANRNQWHSCAHPPDPDLPHGFREVHSLLIEQGLLLEADAKLPSVTREIVVGPIKGSWWGHRRGQEIYAVSRALHEHGDVLATKLVNAKITFVHRAQWGALWWIANCGESWQTRDLSPASGKSIPG